MDFRDNSVLERRPQVRYPWSEWLNGQPWHIHEGEEVWPIGRSVRHLQNVLHTRAHVEGVPVVTYTEDVGSTLVFQFERNAAEEHALTEVRSLLEDLEQRITKLPGSRRTEAQAKLNRIILDLVIGHGGAQVKILEDSDKPVSQSPEDIFIHVSRLVAEGKAAVRLLPD